MDDSEIHFCGECQNMTYLYLDKDKKLIHHCKASEKSEPFTGKDNCIYSIDFSRCIATSNVNFSWYR